MANSNKKQKIHVVGKTMLSLCLNKDFKLVHLVTRNKWLFVGIFCLQKLVKAAENARKDHEYRKNLQVKNLTK